VSDPDRPPNSTLTVSQHVTSYPQESLDTCTLTVGSRPLPDHQPYRASPVVDRISYTKLSRMRITYLKTYMRGMTYLVMRILMMTTLPLSVLRRTDAACALSTGRGGPVRAAGRDGRDGGASGERLPRGGRSKPAASHMTSQLFADFFQSIHERRSLPSSNLYMSDAVWTIRREAGPLTGHVATCPVKAQRVM
jgi:hypothetical protein